MITLTYSVADQHFEKGKSLGILNVSRGLLSHLARSNEIAALDVLLNHTLDEMLDIPPNVRRHYHDSAVRNRLSRAIWDQWGVYSAARRTGNAWLFLPKGFASFMSRPPGRLAAIIHDAMHDYFRQSYPTAISRAELWYLEKTMRATIQQASIIFTISQFTASEVHRLAEQSGLPCPRIITMGVSFNRPSQTPAARNNAIMALVNPSPHKRTDITIDYLQRWAKQSRFDGTIECVGRLPAGARLPATTQWNHHGRLAEQEYQELLRSVRCLVFVSEYEGFGMPPVEAVLAGVCPTYSDITVTREVMAGAGCPFSNGNFDSFSYAMDRALSTPPSTIAAWADELLARHNWNNVSSRVLDALNTCDD